VLGRQNIDGSRIIEPPQGSHRARLGWIPGIHHGVHLYVGPDICGAWWRTCSSWNFSKSETETGPNIVLETL